MSTTDNQPPLLENFNRFVGNQALRDMLERKGVSWAETELKGLGTELGSSEWIARGDLANRYPPRLHLFDRRGRRRDEFEFHPAWHQCLDWIKTQGLAGATWSDSRTGAQVRRAALFQLFAEVECGSLCPATMTHGAIPVLAKTADSFFEPWLHLLQQPTYDSRFVPAMEKSGLLMGMGLTEKQGGSDVRANSTRAEAAGESWYSLQGHKWFFSAAMCDAFLVTAQEAEGLSCFFLPRFTPDGERNALHILREKDKLGDRSNASAEVEFCGAMARRVGEPGRGIATVLEMANHTRLDCANGSVGIMRAALAEAMHYARHRRAFGRQLIEQPLMEVVLADMALELEGHVPLCLEIAACIEAGERDEQAALLARLLTPIAKYWVCKRTPALIAEAMEVTGGNGYVEDGPMPRLFRQSPLNAIWEGAGNVMCLDVLRVLGRQRRVVEALMTWLERTASHCDLYDHALAELGTVLARADMAEPEARLLVERIALLAEARLLLENGACPVVAEAFCTARLGSKWHGTFGTVPQGVDRELLIARAMPDEPLRGLYLGSR